jgi:hypothetical protein
MNAFTTPSEYQHAPAILQEKTAKETGAGVSRHLNGYLMILSLAAILALATAGECGSVMHPASLIYGAVLSDGGAQLRVFYGSWRRGYRLCPAFQ